MHWRVSPSLSSCLLILLLLRLFLLLLLFRLFLLLLLLAPSPYFFSP
jgi:hypothetical protein